MTEQQLDALTQRLDRLEGELRQSQKVNHWWRLLGSGAGVALGLMLLIGATDSKKADVAEEIRAKKFVLVDGGVQHAELSVSDRFGMRTAQLTFFDDRGKNKPLAALESSGNDVVGSWGRLSFFYENGKPQTVLHSGIVQPGLSFYTKEGTTQLFLGMLINRERVANGGYDHMSDRPTLNLHDGKTGNLRAALTITSDDEPFLSLFDSAGVIRLDQSLKADGAARFTLRDSKGKDRVVLGSTDLKETRTGTVIKRSTSSLVLFGEDEKVLWQAP